MPKERKIKKKGKKKEDKIEVKLVVFGSGGVGKSALIVQLIQGVFVDKYDPTLEDSYRKETEYDGKPIILDILDTAGQEEFSQLRDQYIRQGECYMIVYSITNKNSFEEIDTFLEQILAVHELDDEKDLTVASTLPIVIVANKTDLEESRVVSTEEGQQLAAKYGGLAFFETSAKLGKNVKECFEHVTKECFEKVKSQQKGDKKCLIM